METETVIAILSILAPTLSSIVYLGYWLGRKFGKIDERFRQINERLEQLDRRFDELREYVDGRVERLGRAFSSYQEFFVEYLSVKGVVSASEATMQKNEAARLSLLAAMSARASRRRNGRS
jgi:DNA anti-recombination protein RmuC